MICGLPRYLRYIPFIALMVVTILGWLATQILGIVYGVRHLHKICNKELASSLIVSGSLPFGVAICCAILLLWFSWDPPKYKFPSWRQELLKTWEWHVDHPTRTLVSMDRVDPRLIPEYRRVWVHGIDQHDDNKSNNNSDDDDDDINRDSIDNNTNNINSEDDSTVVVPNNNISPTATDDVDDDSNQNNNNNNNNNNDDDDSSPQQTQPLTTTTNNPSTPHHQQQPNVNTNINTNNNNTTSPTYQTFNATIIPPQAPQIAHQQQQPLPGLRTLPQPTNNNPAPVPLHRPRNRHHHHRHRHHRISSSSRGNSSRWVYSYDLLTDERNRTRRSPTTCYPRRYANHQLYEWMPPNSAQQRKVAKDVALTTIYGSPPHDRWTSPCWYDFFSIIIGILVFLICLVPFGWLIYFTVIVSKSSTTQCLPQLYNVSLATILVNWLSPVGLIVSFVLLLIVE